MPELPAQCPITGGPVIVTRFYSPDGDVTFDGRFEVKSPFLALDRNQIEFVLTFIQCEGKFNRMQEELNLSYPTLRSRLKEIIQTLGLEAPDGADGFDVEPDRMDVLAQVESGRLSVDEALISLGSSDHQQNRA